MSRNEHILELLGDEEQCPYLPDQQARMQYKVIGGCSEATYQRLLEHGWRRFGRVFFRPLCTACAACKSLRLDVRTFRTSRSMVRSWRRNRDLVVRMGMPVVDQERLQLFARYHAAQRVRHGWEQRLVTTESYHRGFVEGCEGFGRELTFRHGDRLLAVALIDLLPNAVSAVYCYYDPDQRQRGLGVSSVLHHIALARRRGASFVYLGFWVRDNASLAYKARYKPHALLAGRPDEHSEARWEQAETIRNHERGSR